MLSSTSQYIKTSKLNNYYELVIYKLQSPCERRIHDEKLSICTNVEVIEQLGSVTVSRVCRGPKTAKNLTARATSQLPCSFMKQLVTARPFDFEVSRSGIAVITNISTTVNMLLYYPSSIGLVNKMLVTKKGIQISWKLPEDLS